MRIRTSKRISNLERAAEIRQAKRRRLRHLTDLELMAIILEMDVADLEKMSEAERSALLKADHEAGQYTPDPIISNMTDEELVELILASRGETR